MQRVLVPIKKTETDYYIDFDNIDDEALVHEVLFGLRKYSTDGPKYPPYRRNHKKQDGTDSRDINSEKSKSLLLQPFSQSRATRVFWSFFTASNRNGKQWTA